MADPIKTQIIAFLRAILGDEIKDGVDIAQYNTSTVFSLSEPNTQTVTSVAVNDVTSGITYTYDSALQKVTVTSSLLTDDIVEIDYTYYSNYSDTELVGYIKHAMGYVAINQYATWEFKEDDNIYPVPSFAEQNLIAMIASVIIDPENKSIRTPDFSVTIKNPMTTADLIGKIIAIFKKSPAGVFAMLGATDPDYMRRGNYPYVI